MAAREDVRGARGTKPRAGAGTGTRTRQDQGQNGLQQRDSEVPVARYREAPGLRADGQSDRDERIANGLGWFSIGLGLAQIVSPGGVARLIGVSDDAKSRSLMRAIGIREIATGIGILARPRRAGWVKARVGGDMMDLTLLGAALRSDDTKKGRIAFATAAVAGVTALDVMCSRRLGDKANGAAAAGMHGNAHVAKSITIKRSPEEVYRFWRNFENLPQFMYHLENVQVRGSGRSHWTAKAPGGKTVEWDAETIEDVPNERIAWRSLADADVANSGVVEFRRAPGDRGTEVHVQIHYDPPAGKLGQVVAKLFGEEPAQQVGDDLRRLKQVLEVGEVVRSEASPEGQARPYIAQRAAKHLEGAAEARA
jgi:uncharacterized membrane protein